jgi:hypothetical protein
MQTKKTISNLVQVLSIILSFAFLQCRSAFTKLTIISPFSIIQLYLVLYTKIEGDSFR